MRCVQVFVDDGTIAGMAKPANLTDNRIVAVQRLLMPEVVREGDLMVTVRQWHPSTPIVGPGQELCFPKSTTLRELFDAIERLCEASIPRASLRVGAWRIAVSVSHLLHLHTRPCLQAATTAQVLLWLRILFVYVGCECWCDGGCVAV